MPELPEVETICRGLNPLLSGRTITQVEVFTPAMRTPLTPLLDGGLEGRRFTGVRRRARYLVADLDDGRGLLMHFGMSGVVRVEPPAPKRRHEHLFLHLDDGMIFKFECVRRFSRCEICRPGPDGFPEELASLGVEPLSADYTGELLFRNFQNLKRPVKVALMDNEIVVGIGNIYANETLFACGIDPRRPACRVTATECGQIAAVSRTILERAIAGGGTTFSAFRHVDGSRGMFVEQLQVYGREGEACYHCGTPVAAVRLGGRSSFYCGKCQR